MVNAYNSKTIVHVKAGGSGDRRSWDNAFSDLQKGIDKAYGVAKKYNKIVRVHVAKGTYKPNSCPNGGSGEREKHFSLRNGVEVIGGYSGNGDENNPDIYETILSGDIGTKDDRVYHIFYHPEATSLDSTAKLTEVTITKGNANGENSSPELNDCTFTNNKANSGGGMYNGEFSLPTLTDCEFTDNEAVCGGGMDNGESSPELNKCTFTNNTAGILEAVCIIVSLLHQR